MHESVVLELEFSVRQNLNSALTLVTRQIRTVLTSNDSKQITRHCATLSVIVGNRPIGVLCTDLELFNRPHFFSRYMIVTEPLRPGKEGKLCETREGPGNLHCGREWSGNRNFGYENQLQRTWNHKGSSNRSRRYKNVT
ncbi:hypothetical protein RRG08_027952 [Elysia crispata]|uniref:Uncharacterized protein n=1 Tax=Elysia crispata TaxID=231223 RepID=A0AAE0ZJ82_9GAST|nr:hypothetical protein RRG08_027952 [Elysia crispata]